ncbi:MAG: universal stress protein [Nitrospirota bacterium]
MGGQESGTPHFMGELKSILLCTDGSDYSAGAIRAAINLARECGTIKLTALRVLEFNPEFETEGQKVVAQIESEARAHLDLIREAAAEENIECEAIVRRHDRPDRAIIEEAEKRRVDVIVMGRRGMTGLKKMLMGSVTAKVIGYAPCKVLVVPKDATMRGEHVLLATDGSRYSEAAEREMLSMGRRCRQFKTIVALSVAQREDRLGRAEENVEKVRRDADREGLAVEIMTAVGRPQDVIVETIRQKGIDMAIMGTHGRTGVDRLLIGSVAERVIALSPAAVLVAKTS